MDFIESQRPIYELKARDERILPIDEGFESKYLPNSNGDFMKLLNGKEPDGNVNLRYELFQQNWRKQMSSINNVLLKTDRFKFRSLREFLRYKDRQFDERLISGILNLGSNISNHERLLVNVCRYLREEDDICLIRVNPGVDFNIQRIVRRIEEAMVYEIRQRGNGNRKGKKNNSRRKRKLKDLEGDVDNDDGEIEMNIVEPIYNVVKGKFIDIIDMLKEFKRMKIRLVVMIENGDSMSKELIENVLNMMYEYNLCGEVYCLICISTPFIMFEEKISVLVIGKLKSCTFSIDNSKEAIGQIMEDLLLNINETYNSLIFEPRLVLKFLKMKEDMSIDKFKKMIKMIYMRHYFSQPLSIFWTKDFSKIELRKIYFEIFKTLPSVMMNKGDDEENGRYLKELVFSEGGTEENKIIGEMLRYNLNRLINWRYELRGLIDFLNFLQAMIMKDEEKKIWENNLELFEMIFGKYYQIKKEGGNEKVIKRKMLRGISRILEKMWRVLGSNMDVEIIKSIMDDDMMKGYTEESVSITDMAEHAEKTISEKVIMLDLEGQMFREVCVVGEKAFDESVEGDNPSMRENVLSMLEEGTFTCEVWRSIQESGGSRVSVGDLAQAMGVTNKVEAAWLVRSVWELDGLGLVSIDNSKGIIDRVVWRGV